MGMGMKVKCINCGKEIEQPYESIPCLNCDGNGCYDCEFTGYVYVPNPVPTCSDECWFLVNHPIDYMDDMPYPRE